jgi:membrane protease YdiL (CAAX protease family)
MIIDEPAETVPEAPFIDEPAINNRRYKALMITGICLCVMVYPYLGHVFLIYSSDNLFRIIGSEILKWATLGILYVYANKAEMNSFLLWREEKHSVLFYLKSGIILYALIYASWTVAAIPHYLGYHEDNSLMRKANLIMQSYPVLLVVVCITAGITEELIFRGYILSRLSLFFKGTHWPVIISALIFASVHLAYKSFSEIIFVFLFGLIFGYHYQRYRNLTLLMIMHFVTDIIALGTHHAHK